MSDTPSGSTPDTRHMPRWVPRAVVLFWLGYLGMLVARYSFNRLSQLLILLLVSLFLAFAIEPGVNALSRRGWGRRRATSSIILAIILGVLAFIGIVGTVVGTQLADLATNSEQYVNDTVKFINDAFNTNIDPQAVNDRITDPNGPVQKFIDSQQDRVFSVTLQALGVLLQILSIVLFTYYLVADGPRLRRSICSRLEPDRQRRVLDTWDLAITKTGGYLYSRALLASLSAFFHWIAFQAIGIPAPVAMAGVAQHSDYRNDPWGRLQRTADFLAATSFGPADVAQQAVDRVRAVHTRVVGTTRNGEEYSANDPHLLRWVHIAEVDSFLAAHQVFGANPLDQEGRDAYVSDMAVIARKLGVPAPPSHWALVLRKTLLIIFDRSSLRPLRTLLTS